MGESASGADHDAAVSRGVADRVLDKVEPPSVYRRFRACGPRVADRNQGANKPLIGDKSHAVDGDRRRRTGTVRLLATDWTT
jgi:hypothetical protein